MKALRYLLMMIAVMGVLSVSAQTPKYGKTYKPYGNSVYCTAQVNAQMPSAEMRSTGSMMMSSGSTLPQAAVTGVTTADYSAGTKPNGPRKIGGGNSGGGEGPQNPDDPWATPIGDAGWPLAMCALAYLIIRVARRRALND